MVLRNKLGELIVGLIKYSTTILTVGSIIVVLDLVVIFLVTQSSDALTLSVRITLICVLIEIGCLVILLMVDTHKHRKKLQLLLQEEILLNNQSEIIDKKIIFVLRQILDMVGKKDTIERSSE